ncbi:MAG: protein translocase subunit SecD [Alphaproteobacteria bacterium]|nr:protein translocase subunit SecD [Alphaproteobacteria bacterium]
MSVFGVLLSIPNFFTPSQLSWLPGFIPQWRLTLGLDLQGGAHLLLEVDEGEVIKTRLSKLRKDVRAGLIEEQIAHENLRVSGTSVTLHIREPLQVDNAKKILEDLAFPEGTSFLGGASADEMRIDDDGDGVLALSLTQRGVNRLVSAVISQSIEVIRRRIDQLGTVDPTIQKQGHGRIVVQVPGLHDPDRLKILLGSTARLSFRLVNVTISPEQALAGHLPLDSELIEGVEDPPRLYVLKREEILTGERLVDAQPRFSSLENEPVVSFRFDVQGARRFAKITQENVGRPFAIVLDDEVISAPVIREPILGGSGQISGRFSVKEANDLAILLRAGALPAKLTIVEERTVGPGLGADQVHSGVLAALFGGGAVFVFMIAAYGLFGLFSNIALIINLSMIIAALSVLGATLTLSGIAGIVLTIGMAVDANVLIFERIRESMESGESAIICIDSGFSRAKNAILDANITTLIAAIILFYLGAGPVRGFAVTLAIGVVTSVFTAFTLSRLFISLWVRWRRPVILPI